MALIPLIVLSLVVLAFAAPLLSKTIGIILTMQFADPTIEFLFKVFVPVVAIIVVTSLALAFANYIPVFSGGKRT